MSIFIILLLRYQQPNSPHYNLRSIPSRPPILIYNTPPLLPVFYPYLCHLKRKTQVNVESSISHILVSLKTRNFKLYFTGMCVSLTGTWMQQIAMSWLVYELTGSVLLLATITFVAQIPILIATPFMSVFVDRFDRHKILLFTQALSAFQALLLAWLTRSEEHTSELQSQR